MKYIDRCRIVLGLLDLSLLVTSLLSILSCVLFEGYICHWRLDRHPRLDVLDVDFCCYFLSWHYFIIFAALDPALSESDLTCLGFVV